MNQLNSFNISFHSKIYHY